MHEHHFQYSAEASTPTHIVTVCRGCGEASLTPRPAATQFDYWTRPPHTWIDGNDWRHRRID